MNYKRLGNYIKRISVKNADGLAEILYGINIDKFFMPSVANVIGTDLTRYKVVSNNQFACNRMHVGRDKRLPIALSDRDYDFIVSPAYDVFEINDVNALLPEYLMMWFTREEFDRNCWFHTDSDVRGKLDWDAFMDMTLPIPSIEKQQQIVAEYNTVTNRIKLSEKINTNLEATAQALYKHWFVDFNFPITEESCPELVSGSPELVGKPYKSSGGKMVYNEELDKEIPVGWSVESVKDFSVDMKSGATPNRSEIDYWNSNDYSWIKTGELKNSVIINSEESISALGLKNSSTKLLPINSVLIAMYGQGNTKGQVGYLKIEATTNQACCAMICEDENYSTFLYYHLRVNRDEIVKDAIGGAQPNLSKELIEKISIIKPTKDILLKTPFIEILNSRWKTSLESQKLKKLQSLLLAKMTQVELKPQAV